MKLRFLAGIVLLSSISILSATQTIYVAQGLGGRTATNGNSWATSYPELRTALLDPRVSTATATNPVEIWIAKGNYRPTAGTDQTVSFQLTSYVHLFGGFVGTETFAGQRDGKANLTFLNGDIGTVQANTIEQMTNWNGLTNLVFNPDDPGFQDNSYNVVRAEHATGVLLDSLIITGGNAGYTNMPGEQMEAMAQPLPDDLDGRALQPLDNRVAGGGLYFANAPGMETNNSPDFSLTDLTLQDCAFINNSARGFGGGMALREARVVATRNFFVRNLAGHEGGGVWAQNHYGHFLQCEFFGNMAQRSGAGMHLETLASKRTLNPLYTDEQFGNLSGHTKEDVILTLQHYQGEANAGMDMLSSQVLASDAGVDNVTPQYKNYYRQAAKDGLKIGKALLQVVGEKYGLLDPKLTISPMEAYATKGAAGALSSTYSWVGLAVTAVDLGTQIAEALGVSPNDPFVRGWSTFSSGFNTYASPVGLFELAYFYFNPPPTFEERVTGLRTQDDGYYNKMGNTVLYQCRFDQNVTGGIGGGLCLFYDNVLVEDSWFVGNSAGGNAGAMALLGWTSPQIFNCAFVRNNCSAGNSAIVNAFHPHATFLGCTVVNNTSGVANGFAMDNETGADVLIGNSIFWGNKNATNSTGGADIFTATYDTLDDAGKNNYDQAGDDRYAWVGVCDIRYSCVQSLRSLPTSPGRFFLFHGYDSSLSANYYSGDQLAKIQLFSVADRQGTLYFNGFMNCGEGNRDTLLNTDYGNTDGNPMLVHDVYPFPGSPVIGVGDSAMLNPVNRPFSAYDLVGSPRSTGISIGAVDNPVGSDTILYVNPNATGNGTGIDWANAMTSLRQATDTPLAPGAAIWVAAGTYYPTNGTDRNAYLYLKDGVSIYGGFAGGETNVAQSDPVAHPTILSGNIGDPASDSDNSHNLMKAFGTTNPRVIHGLTFTKARETTYAGALEVSGPTVIEYCTFLDNTGGYGGGLALDSDTVTILGCTFRTNQATAGSALFSGAHRLTIRNCNFVDNATSDGTVNFANPDGYTDISGSIFFHNSSSRWAAAIDSGEGSLVVRNCTIYSNTSHQAYHLDLPGSGILLTSTSASLVVENNILWLNRLAGSSAPIELQQISSATKLFSLRGNIIEHLDKLADPNTSDNLDIDPIFSGNGTDGLQPPSNFVGVDAGVTVQTNALFPTDIDGHPRWHGTIDIGAFEFPGNSTYVPLTITQTTNCDLDGLTYTFEVHTPTNTFNANVGEWEVESTAGAGFQSVAYGPFYSGLGTSKMTIIHPTTAMNGYRYRYNLLGQGISRSVKLTTRPGILYVNPAAGGIADGLSWDTAYLTISDAVKAAQQCTQIWVKEGTYVEPTIYPGPEIRIYGGFTGTETNRSQRDWVAHPAILSPAAPGVVLDFEGSPEAPIDADTVVDGFTFAGSTGFAAVDIEDSSPTLRNCVFSDSAASAVVTEGGNPVLDTCDFLRSGRTAVIVSHGQPFFTGCRFLNNHNSSTAAALAINNGANVQMQDCLFQNNGGGSTAVENDASLTAWRCVFTGNTGPSVQNTATLVLENSVFARNVASFKGGAIAHYGRQLWLTHVTMVYNEASLAGGGLYDQGSGVQIRNSIFWKNDLTSRSPAAVEAAQIEVSAGSPAPMITSSIVQGLASFKCAGNMALNPLFENVATNDFRLIATSPAINAGITNPPLTQPLDAVGNNRFVGGAPDLGAYEYQGNPSNTLRLFDAPDNLTACEGTPAQFTFSPESGQANVTWQKWDGTNFVTLSPSAQLQISISNGTNTLLYPSVTTDLDGSLFRILINGATNSVPTFSLSVPSSGILRVNGAVAASGDGSSWAQAFKTIGEAQVAASGCAEIWVANGTYDASVGNMIDLTSSVRIYGGFAGNEISRSARDWNANVTRLVAGTNSNYVIQSDGSRGVAGRASILDGFHISGSMLYAMFLNNGSPTIRNCVFETNATAVLAATGSQPLFDNCVFQANTNSAVQIASSAAPVFSNCTFTSNTLAGARSGAAITAANAALFVDNCTFNGNYSTEAVINAQSSSTTISHSRFIKNQAVADTVLNIGLGSFTLTDSLIAQNTSTSGGAAVNVNQSTVNFRNVTVADNAGSYTPVGISQSGGVLSLRNCILWGNKSGGNATEAAQIGVQSGGANTGTLVRSSIVQGLSTWTNASDANLSWQPLFVDASNGDYHLSQASPAVDIGDASGVSSDSTDLGGLPRLVRQIDLGAYELQTTPTNTVFVYNFPSDTTACGGSGVQFSILGVPAGTNQFEWQQFDGTNFNTLLPTANLQLLNDGTIGTLSITTTDPSLDGARFRVKINGGAFVTPAFTLHITTPSVLYVNGAVSSSGAGTAWNSAFKTVQEAVAAAGSCTEIWVAQGIYQASDGAVGGGSIPLTSQVRLYGGFVGTETNRIQRNWQTNITRLVPGSAGQVLFSSGLSNGTTGRDATLDGFYVSGATNTAVIISAADPTIRNCVFENNPASVLVQQDAKPLFFNCTFQQNSASAISLSHAAGVEIYNSFFLNNSSQNSGAAISANTSVLLINGSCFSSNSAPNGVVVDASASTVRIERCAITNNSSPSGSILHLLNSTLALHDSLIARNNSGIAGTASALFGDTSTLEIRNATIANNSSGGMFSAGLYVYRGSLSLRNSILWGNQTSTPYVSLENNQVTVQSATAAVSHDIIQGLTLWNTADSGNIAYAPLFADPTNGNFRLTSGSPGIDAGDNTGVYINDLDLDGFPRISGNVDLGAYEFQGTAGVTKSGLAIDFTSRNICTGQGTSFSVHDTSGALLTVQWQIDTGSGFGNLSPDSNQTINAVTNGSTLTLSSVPITFNGVRYRFSANSSTGYSYSSDPITVTVGSPHVVYVRSDATGNGSGTDWTNACRTLSPALAGAAGCTEIWIAAGNYALATNETLNLPLGASLYGGFPSGGGDWTQRNSGLNVTIISGTTNRMSALLDLQSSAQTAATGEGTTIDGLTFQSGTDGILVSGRAPSIQNCSFQGFSQSAVLVQNGSPLIANCVFATNSFAGITTAGDGSSVMVQTSTFNSNTGYGVANSGLNSQVTVQDSIFTNNQFNAVNTYAGTSTDIIRCRFLGNTSSAINNAGTMRVRQSLLSENSAIRGSAIFNSGTLAVVNCTITANSATDRAAGIYEAAGALTLQNTIVWGNTAPGYANHEASQIFSASGTLAASYSIIQYIETLAGPGLIYADPFFLGATSGNYQLDSRSPGINAGWNNAVTAGETDLAGQPRIQQNTVDIGAYETSATNNAVLVKRLPVSTNACAGTSAQFDVAGQTNHAYQWQYNLAGGWTNFDSSNLSNFAGTIVSAAGVSTLTLSNVSASLDGLQVRVSITNAAFISPAATLSVPTSQIIYVDASGPSGGNGTSWTNALRSLSDAIGHASICERVIWVAQGTYAPVEYSYAPGSGSFQITQRLEIYGGFPTGGGTWSQRNPQAYPTVLSGNVPSGRTQTIVYIFGAGLDTNTVLDGLTIAHGQNGLSIQGASPTIRNVVITDNSEVGVALSGGSASFENCQIVNNIGNEGGASVYESSARFVNCTFQGNSGGYAGGLSVQTPTKTVTLVDCLLTGNSSTNRAAGIDLYGSMHLANTTVAANHGGYAGGVSSSAGTLTIENSIFWGNRSVSTFHSIEEQQILLDSSATFRIVSSSIEGRSTLSGAGVTGDNPVFVAPINASQAPSTAGNFTLAPCSPLIDAGTNTAVTGVALDLAGANRIFNNVDLGPYELNNAAAPMLKIVTQPQDITYCRSSTNQFIVNAVGTGLSYQWEYAAPGGTFVSLNGVPGFANATTAALTVLNQDTSLDGYRFRVSVTSSEGCNAYSREATLHVFSSRFYVNAGMPNDTGDGSSWTNAFKTLSHALQQISIDPCGTEVWVAGGTYRTSETNDLTAKFQLQTGLSVYGGFAGNETNLLQRNWNTNPTILQGVPGTDDIFRNDATYTPIANVRIDGFVLRKANTGIHNVNVVSNCVIANCSFTNLTANGILNYLSTVTVQGCRFDNLAGNGCGLYDLIGSAQISNCTFTSNTLAVYQYKSSVLVQNCSFEANSNALNSSSAALTIADSAFVRNQQGLHTYAGSVNMQRDAFRGNGVASGLGGAAFITIASAVIDDSLFSGNIGSQGGAIYADGNPVIFHSCTFAGNRANYAGGAIEATGPVRLYNCILWDNSSTRDGDTEFGQCDGYVDQSRYNIVENIVDTGNFRSPDNHSIAPGFVASVAASNAPTVAGDFQLTVCSPVLDAGATNFPGSSLTDAAGNPRIFGLSVDPGAYEVQAYAATDFSTQPQDAFGSQSVSAIFTAAIANAANFSFQWEVTTNGLMFAPLSEGGAYTGVNTTTLNVRGGTDFNANRYRLRATHVSGCTFYTRLAAFHYYQAPANSTVRNGILSRAASGLNFTLDGGANGSTVNDADISLQAMETGWLNFGDGSLANFSVTGNTLALTPQHPFHPGEKVFVTTTPGLKNAAGFSASPTTLEFRADVKSWAGAFQKGQTFALSGNPTVRCVETGDLNRDGFLDLIVGTDTGVRILLNDGTGNFTETGSAISTGSIRKIVLADLRKTHALDAVFMKADNSLEIWSNNGSAGFTQTTPALSNIVDVTVGDLNNDGALDLFLLTTGPGQIWCNNGTGGLSDSGMRLATTNGVSVALGDMDNDGWLDAVVLPRGTAPAQLWQNQNGTYVAGPQIGFATSGYDPSHTGKVLLADVNQDGNLDIIVAQSNPQGYVTVISGNGAGFFTSYWQSSLQTTNGSTLAVGDINGDHRMDLIYTGRDGNIVNFNNTGTAFNRTAQGTIASAQTLVLGDFDGDGALDIAIATTSGSLAVSLYQPTHQTGDEDILLSLNPQIFSSSFAVLQTNAFTAVQIEALPHHGTLTLSNQSVVVGQVIPVSQLSGLQYLSAAHYSGRDSFDWIGQASDGPHAGDFTFYISLKPTPSSVVAHDDFIRLFEGQSTSSLTNGTTNVLANDLNTDGTLTAVLLQGPTNGTVQLNTDGTFTYQHDGSETRQDSFRYLATNIVNGKFDSATVFVTVDDTNQPPSAISLAQATVYEDQSAGVFVGDLSTTDQDAADQGLHTYSLVPGAGSTDNAKFTISGSKIYTATVLFGSSASPTIRVRSTDPAGLFVERIFTVTVKPLPQGDSNFILATEETPQPITLTGTPTTSPLSFSVVTPPQFGTLSGTPPNLIYTPTGLFSGNDSFTFTTSDGMFTSAVATVSIYVQPVNHSPVSTSSEVSALAGSPVNITLTASDVDNDPLNFIITPPPGGLLTGSGSNYVYTPSTYASGLQFLLFAASDGQTTSAVAVVTINVTPVNHAPFGVSRPPVQVQENHSVTFSILGSDPDNEPVSYQIVSSPQHGVLFGNQTNFFTFQPVNFTYFPQISSGTDSFSFIVTDGKTNSAPTTVSLIVNPLPRPTADSITITTDQDTAVPVTLNGVDPLGQTLQYFLASPASGSLSGTPPNLVYTPRPQFVGTDSFTYTTQADSRGSSQATVTINVLHLDTAPVAVSQQITNLANNPYALLLQATDANGDQLTYRITSLPTHGTLTTNSLPWATYTPNSFFYGQDSFQFVASDGEKESAPATVSFTISKNEQYPIVGDDVATIYKGGTVVLDVLTNDSDIWGDPLTIVGVSQPIQGNGTVTFTRNTVTYASSGTGNFDDFYYYVSNGSLTNRGVVQVNFADRELYVGGGNGNPATLADAINLANSYGPSLEWVIHFNQYSFDSATNVPGRGPTAFAISGNIRLVPTSYNPPYTLLFQPSPIAPSMRLFYIAPGARLRLENMTLTGGVAQQGGAIFNEGTLELFNVTATNNIATGSSSNSAYGGAIYSRNGSMQIINSGISNNTAAFAGGFYQIGDGTNASLVISNSVIAGHGGAFDFFSTQTNGGSASIQASVFRTENPTAPWFDALSPSYTVAQRFSVHFPSRFGGGAFSLSATPATPWSGSTFVIGATGGENTLTLSPAPSTSQSAQTISLCASNNSVSYLQKFNLAIDTNITETPIVRDDAATMQINRSVLISVLANDEDPEGRPLTLVSVSTPRLGVAQIQGDKVYYTNSLSNPNHNSDYSDSFTYVASNGSLSATGHVAVVMLGTNYAVGSTNDSDRGSLRDAIARADAYGPYDGFNINLFTRILSPSSSGDNTEGPSAFIISNNIVIDGTFIGIATLSLSSNTSPMRFFHVAKGATLTLRNVRLTGGTAMPGVVGPGRGGAIFNDGTLILQNVTIDNCSAIGTTNAPGLGGAIFNRGGIIQATNCQITNNIAGHGGGIYNLGQSTEAHTELVGGALDNPNSPDDLNSATSYGGTVFTSVKYTQLPRPGAPWVGPLPDLLITTNTSIPFNISPQVSSNATLNLDSGNLSVVRYRANSSFTGSGSSRRLTITPIHNGIVDLSVELTDSSVTFARTFHLTITGGDPVNPDANPDSFTIYRGEVARFPVLTNDVDYVGGTLRLISVSQATQGSVSIESNQIVYAHSASSLDPDSFTYVITNDLGGGATGTVAIVSVLDDQLYVTNANEVGPGTLHDAVDLAQNRSLTAPWQIIVAPSLAGQTVTLTDYQYDQYDLSAFEITGHLLIDASQAPGFTLKRDDGYFAAPMRHFYVYTNAFLELKNMRLTGGLDRAGDGDTGQAPGGAGATFGGSVVNEGTFIADHVTFDNNQLFAGSGADYSPYNLSGSGGGWNGAYGYTTSGGNNGDFGGGGSGLPTAGSLGGHGGFGGGDGYGLGPGPAAGGNGGFGGGGGAGLYGGGGGGLAAGGAIFNNGGIVDLTSCVFTTNSVNGGPGGNGSDPAYNGQPGQSLGGAIFNLDGVINISNTTFINNNAADGGVAIYSVGNSTNASLTLNGVTISNASGGLSVVTHGINARSELVGSSNSIDSVTGPFMSTIADQMTAGPIAIPFTVTAPQGDPAAYSITAFADNAKLVPNNGFVATRNGTNATLLLTPALRQLGATYVTVRVTDTLRSTSTRFQLTITNAAPVAVDDALTTWLNTTISFSASSLVLNDTDLNGDALTVVSTGASSTQGGSVVLASGVITYTPPSGFVGQDSFLYTVSDGLGGTSSGHVIITVRQVTLGTPTIKIASGLVQIRFFGTPGQQYRIESANQLNGPWTDLSGPISPDSNGALDYQNLTAPSSNTSFYRLVPAQ